MTENSPRVPYQGVHIQAIEYVRQRSEPGEIFGANLTRYLEAGMSPDAMLDDVEAQHGIRLSTMARVALGGWAHEATGQHQNEQAQLNQGEL